jgi:hypothetical protein
VEEGAPLKICEKLERNNKRGGSYGLIENLIQILDLKGGQQVARLRFKPSASLRPS